MRHRTHVDLTVYIIVTNMIVTNTDSHVYQLFTMSDCLQNCIVVHVPIVTLILFMSLCLHVRAAPMSIKAPGPQCTMLQYISAKRYNYFIHSELRFTPKGKPESMIR